MDEHFRTAPLGQNLPMMLGLIGVWHRNMCGHGSRAVIPYDQRLSRLPAYLQQLDMESNGKSVTRDGAQADRAPAPSCGASPAPTASMPSSSSSIRAPTSIPVEFLIAAQSHEPELKAHHDLLMANCLAQSEALMRGRTLRRSGSPARSNRA